MLEVRDWRLDVKKRSQKPAPFGKANPKGCGTKTVSSLNLWPTRQHLFCVLLGAKGDAAREQELGFPETRAAFDRISSGGGLPASNSTPRTWCWNPQDMRIFHRDIVVLARL